ncbi:lysosomal Pro-X carboxypeptidase isoform X2 [Ricinus communis]|uniref:lysosomal Pro-X carboxypeptidase isoform X2 n=1 Tax=Ricinus communis TaxID=3988 RepID=UPI00201A8003|nr:lysosomal Pro-X carboxypeptidase isoform X2 [Ricinus communis]
MAAPTLPNLLLSHAFLLLLTIITTTSSPSLASQPSNFHRPPRFLGKFSHKIKPPPPPPPHHHHNYQQYRYETRYFYQRLDHFSFSNLPKFPQRYLINSDNWSGPDKLAPIFLYCGNEGDIVWFAENTGFVWEIAPRFGAMVVFPEHRYYGESIPYGSRDEAYKNASTLSYLTAEQALADFAVLITDLKRNLTAEDCPVVLFGGSYGGMLAAWMRLKYPHIAIGALAASAPILQFENVVPHEIFYDIVSNDFKRESSRCFNTIKESWNAIASEGLKENGLVKLSRTFHMCSDLNSTDELADWLESAYSYLAMVDYPYPAEFMMPLPGHPIREVCKRIDGCPDGTSILERVFEGVSVYYNYTGNVDCFELDDDPHGLDGWNWQACTEMVMPMASSKYESMFPTYDFNYTSFEKQCWDDFRVVSRPRWIMTEFGGQDIKTSLEKFGSNIIFSNGLLDPWSGGSVLQNISDTVVALVTEEGAHHIDLRPSTPEDPDWLVEQRATEVKLIEGWINDHNQKKRATFDM